MKNYFWSGLLLAAMLLTFAACGEKPAAAPAETETPVETVQTPAEPETAPEQEETPVAEEAPAEEEISLEAVRQAIIDGLEISDPLPLETDALLDLYGIEGDSVAQSAGFVTMSGTFPDEIILVEAVDQAAAEAVQSCLQRRLDEVLVQSQTYDAENYAAAQECRVRTDGLYVALILSPRQAEMAEIYESFIAE